MLKTIFAKELKRYTYSDLKILLDCKDYNHLDLIIKKLKEYSILKTIRKDNEDIEELNYEDEVIEEVSSNSDEIYYVFNYVGIVIVFEILIACYPKYINNNKPLEEMKQIIKVISKYDSKHKIIKMYNESDYSGSYNYLAMALYLLNDYYEYGIYRNDQEIIETNGEGNIIWDRTINETFMLISNNKPYYLELKTKKNYYDDFDFFTVLHKIILTKISKEFDDSNIFELFDLAGVDLTDETLSDVGDIEYISYKILKEINVVFNTRKLNLLKLFYTYINKDQSINDIECISYYGTQSFNLVWEEVCAEIFDNKLDTKLKDMDKPIVCNDNNQKLIDVIEKPEWTYTGNLAAKTLIPDAITIYKNGEYKYFIILDAKYYYPLLEKGQVPRRQPGMESITKQFLYQLAYKKLIEDNGYEIRNIFILPTEEEKIIDKSSVTMDMFTKEPLKLKPILVKFIPAVEAYDLYLLNKKIDVLKLLNNY